MTEYHLTVDQTIRHWVTIEADSPVDAARAIARGDWSDRDNEVLSGRVQARDEEGLLVYDDHPEDCTACGRNEHAGFRRGLPYCHRHLTSPAWRGSNPKEERA